MLLHLNQYNTVEFALRRQVSETKITSMIFVFLVLRFAP